MSRTRMGSLIFLIAIIVIVSCFVLTGNDSEIRVSPGSEGIALSGPEGTARTVLYDEITALEYWEQPDLGWTEEGGTKLSCNYGVWNSPAWGQYDSFVNTKIPTCILLRSEEGALVFNYENQQTTRSIYEELQLYLNQKE